MTSGGLSRVKSCVQLENQEGNKSKRAQSLLGSSYLSPHLELECTALFLAAHQEDDNEANDENGDNDHDSNDQHRLYLPRRESAPQLSLDEYLCHIPQVASRAENLPDLPQELRGIKSGNKIPADDEVSTVPPSSAAAPRQTEEAKSGAGVVRCLNVLQGEVAHVSALQADLVVSAEATTCHVVALRSTCPQCQNICGGTTGGGVVGEDESFSCSTSACTAVPLVSLAHVDKARVYNASLESMVQKHVAHHREHERTSVPGRSSSSRNYQPAATGRIENQQMTGDDHDSKRNEEEGDDYGFYFEDEDEVGIEPDNNDGSRNSFLPQLSLSHRKSVSMPSLVGLPQRIDMELHMAGGFLDKAGLSQELSTSLITTFSDLADKYRDQIRITLSTAAISCMNTVEQPVSTQDGLGDDIPIPTPRCRGLGVDTRTGQVFAVRTTLPTHLEGPAVEIRSARAWAQAVARQRASQRLGSDAISQQSPEEETLYVIHDTSSDGQIRIAPFPYEPIKNLSILLKMPDDVLLKYTSTSPECESDQFCNNVRRVVSFLNHVPSETVFGQDCRKSLVYSRSMGQLNEWENST